MIAITGIGIISPAGIGKEHLIRTLSRTETGIHATGNFGLPCAGISRVGEVKNFSAKDYLPAMKARRMSRFSQFSLASAIEAVNDAGLGIDEGNCYSVAIAVGTGLASTDSTDRFFEGLLREGPDSTNPMVFPETVQNIAASHISIHFGTRGQNITFSHADISSELALFYGCELLKDGRADRVIVSGADELSMSVLMGYSSFGILSNEMRPFDRKRKGFVLGEGGATIVLERVEDALQREADVYCTVDAVEIASHPASNPAYDTSRESMKSVMRSAMKTAGIGQPGFISASANSTSLDGLEAEALTEVFGAMVPVTAFRSYYGYFQGDGILRIASAALCMDNGIVPAIAGLDDPFPECRLDLVQGSPRKVKTDSAIITSFSTGGSAAAIILKKMP